MKYKDLADALDFYMFPNKVMAKRHPKAAKKKRIRNKWRNRFGDKEGEFKKMVMDPNAMMLKIGKVDTNDT